MKSLQPPKWIKPQLTRLVDEAPTGKEWLHEIKYDGYRMHARIDGDNIQLLTRTGLDWSHRYKRTIEALRSLKVKSAYLDGELCALNPDGVPVFSRLQAAMDESRTDQLVFFAFDLLYLNGESTAQLPLIKRKERAQTAVQEGDSKAAVQRACDWRHIGALRQPAGRSTLQPSGVEVDVGLGPCLWDSARKCVQNLPFPAPILHTGQLYLPPASSLLMGRQDSRPRADKVNST